ncbi:IS4 family transposase [Streptomyces sp. NBC_01216]|uniref:IS4 family transposase n=1 Tax=Streptomyces sp. NBC_01216 TaxID=2903778 RepID=UPI002E113372|nr:IS4 family transposase [Streptomyces sp. NBC_01216]
MSDRIAVGLLTRTFPPELVDRVVAECGRPGVRTRLLPPRVVVYFVLAMCLFSGQGYEEVARLLTQGLAWAKRWSGSWQVPSTAAISRARVKLGPEPMKALFAEVARPLATGETQGARYGRWRLVAIDGTVLGAPDSDVNAAHFGRPKTHRIERCAYPQVQMEALAECGTHAITAAALGPLSSSEPALARSLFSHLCGNDLLLADRGVCGASWWPW